MTSTDKFEATFIFYQLNTGKMKVTFALLLFYFRASKFLYVLTSSLRVQDLFLSMKGKFKDTISNEFFLVSNELDLV